MVNFSIRVHCSLSERSIEPKAQSVLKAKPKSTPSSNNHSSHAAKKINASQEIGSPYRATNPKAKFKHWLQARESAKGLNEEENEDESINCRKLINSNVPLQSYSASSMHSNIGERERSAVMNSLMSPQDFDSLADSIVARVKQDISCDLGTSFTRSTTFIKPDVTTSTRESTNRTRENSHHMNRENIRERHEEQVDLSSHYCPSCRKLMVNTSNLMT